jgi:hypothetical protein
LPIGKINLFYQSLLMKLRHDQSLKRVFGAFVDRHGMNVGQHYRFYDEERNHLPFNTLIRNVPSETVILERRRDFILP